MYLLYLVNTEIDRNKKGQHVVDNTTIYIYVIRTNYMHICNTYELYACAIMRIQSFHSCDYSVILSNKMGAPGNAGCSPEMSEIYLYPHRLIGSILI